MGWLEDELIYDDYLADFSANFHDLRGERRFAECLALDSYVASQDLAVQLLAAVALGIIYPSVRRKGGTCLVCFRPALVINVRKGHSFRYFWRAKETPEISRL